MPGGTPEAARRALRPTPCLFPPFSPSLSLAACAFIASSWLYVKRLTGPFPSSLLLPPSGQILCYIVRNLLLLPLIKLFLFGWACDDWLEQKSVLVSCVRQIGYIYHLISLYNLIIIIHVYAVLHSIKFLKPFYVFILFNKLPSLPTLL